MEETINKKIVILGGGLAGLCLAKELEAKKLDYLVIEKEAQVGGLARTFYKNGFGFDIGGHRFHTTKQHVHQEFIDLLKDQYLTVRRKSRILLDNKYFDYPLKFGNAIISLGVKKTTQILKEYLQLRFKKNKGGEIAFDQWIINRFGNTLFETYFKPYTEKIWGISCSKISSDWAAQRISLLNLTDVLKNMLLKLKKVPKTLISHFLYPCYGIGSIANEMANLINKHNKKILLNAELAQVTQTGENTKEILIKINGHANKRLIRIKANQIISTIPLPNLIDSFVPVPPLEILNAKQNLEYRALIVVFIILNKNKISDDTWTYFPEKKLIFGRIHEPGNWSPHLVQKDKTSLCVEIFCSEGDQTWNKAPAELSQEVINNLAQLKLIRHEDVLETYVKKITHAYPIYNVNYQQHLQNIKNYLHSLNQIHITGRTGSFIYHNMDQVWETSLELGKKLQTTNLN